MSGALGTPLARRAGVPRRHGRGVGAVVMVILLVSMATLAAAVLRLSVQGASSAEQNVLGSRAQVAARSGIEWGLYQALKAGWSTCSAASQTLDMTADTGMRVTVSCDSTTYYEGESAPATPATVRVYTIDAVACTSTSACPDATAAVRQGYVERRMQSTVVN